MARAGIPHPRIARGIARHPWVLHLAVLVVAFGAVLSAVLSRAGDGSPSTSHRASSPPDPGPAALAPATLPSPAPTPEPSPSPTPPAPALPPPVTPAPAPEPTETPQSLAPPPATPAPRPVVTARALDSAALRTSPSREAIIAGYVPPGGAVTVIACAEGCAWLQVVTPSGTLWSARYFWSVAGDLSTFGGR